MTRRTKKDSKTKQKT